MIPKRGQATLALKRAACLLARLLRRASIDAPVLPAETRMGEAGPEKEPQAPLIEKLVHQRHHAEADEHEHQQRGSCVVGRALDFLPEDAPCRNGKGQRPDEPKFGQEPHRSRVNDERCSGCHEMLLHEGAEARPEQGMLQEEIKCSFKALGVFRERSFFGNQRYAVSRTVSGVAEEEVKVPKQDCGHRRHKKCARHLAERDGALIERRSQQADACPPAGSRSGTNQADGGERQGHQRNLATRKHTSDRRDHQQLESEGITVFRKAVELHTRHDARDA